MTDQVAHSEKEPVLADDFLGAQPKFKELGLSTDSHDKPNIRAPDNHFDIKLAISKPLHIAHELTRCKTGGDVSQYVLRQYPRDGYISFSIQCPEPGYYKLQIFACPPDSKQLMAVYNYVINCTMALKKSYPFPKQFSQWKEGCLLTSPLVLHKDSNLAQVDWRVKVPHAKKVAVIVNGEFFHLEEKGRRGWVGQFNFEQFKGKEALVALSGNFTDDETSYTSILEYHI